MRTKGSYSLVFADDPNDALLVKDVSEFFFYLRALYGLLIKIEPDISIENLIKEPQGNIYKHVHDQMNMQKAAELFQADLKEDELTILKLRHESPFEALITGSIIALVAAVIISGGEADFKIGERQRVGEMGDLRLVEERAPSDRHGRTL